MEENLNFKYDVKTFDDVIEQEVICKIFQKALQTLELPHLLLHGNHGVGKSSIVNLFLRNLIPNSEMKEKLLRIDTSNDNNINTVREQIKSFANIKVSGIPIKIVLIDDFDLMTEDAQFALRRVIEQNSDLTKFILICNNVFKVIEPIQSRCVVIKMKPISNEKVEERLALIIENEKINISREELRNIADECNGDLRKAINLVNNSKRMNANIDFANIINKSIVDLIKEIRHLLCIGYDGKEILNQAFNYVMLMEDVQKIKILDILSSVDVNMANGADELLQLVKLFSSISL